MQYILTQDEYDSLNDKSAIQLVIANTELVYFKRELTLTQERNAQLRKELKELNDKYSKLLVFGVTANHQRKQQ